MSRELMKFFDVELARSAKLYRDTDKVNARELIDLLHRCQQVIYERLRQSCAHPHDFRLPCPWPNCRAGVPGDRYVCIEPEDSLVASYVASTPPNSRRGTLQFRRQTHGGAGADVAYGWEVELPRTKRVLATAEELESTKMLIDALLDGAPSQNADAVVEELTGILKILYTTIAKLRVNAPPSYAEVPATGHMEASAKSLEGIASRLEKLGESVRKIRNEPLSQTLHTLASKIGVDIKAPSVIKLETSFHDARVLLLEVGGRVYRSWITRVNIMQHNGSFEPYVNAQGLPMRLANGLRQRVEFDVSFTGVQQKDDDE